MTLTILRRKTLKPDRKMGKRHEPTVYKKDVSLAFTFIKACLQDMSSQFTRSIWN